MKVGALGVYRKSKLILNHLPISASRQMSFPFFSYSIPLLLPPSFLPVATTFSPITLPLLSPPSPAPIPPKPSSDPTT